MDVVRRHLVGCDGSHSDEMVVEDMNRGWKMEIRSNEGGRVLFGIREENKTKKKMERCLRTRVAPWRKLRMGAVWY
jgi:hypothetical protein